MNRLKIFLTDSDAHCAEFSIDVNLPDVMTYNKFQQKHSEVTEKLKCIL